MTQYQAIFDAFNRVERMQVLWVAQALVCEYQCDMAMAIRAVLDFCNGVQIKPEYAGTILQQERMNGWPLPAVIVE